MTQAPAYPLQHAHLGDENPYELVNDSRWGAIERWRLNGLLTGEVGALRALSDHIKNDTISALDQIEQRERTVAAREARCDQHERELTATAARLDRELDRAAAHWDKIEQARADQARAAEEPLPAPPDQPADPAPGSENDAALPSEPQDDPDQLPEPPLDDDTHVPSGDLHVVPATDPEQHSGQDERGEFLRRHDAGDEVEFPSGELPSPPTTAPPVAAGLDGD